MKLQSHFRALLAAGTLNIFKEKRKPASEINEKITPHMYNSFPLMLLIMKPPLTPRIIAEKLSIPAIPFTFERSFSGKSSGRIPLKGGLKKVLCAAIRNITPIRGETPHSGTLLNT